MAKARGDDLKKLAGKYSGGGKWLSKMLTDDEDVVEGVFIGDPVGVEAVWDKRANRNVEYDETRHNEKNVSLHILYNFFEKETQEVYIWDKGTKFFNDWLKKKAKKGMKRWWKIRRDGEAGDTKTKYKLIAGEKLDDEDWQAIINLEVHDLENLFAERDDDDDDDDDNKDKKKKKKEKSSDSNSNNCISPEIAKKLKTRLQGMSAGAMDSFCSKFGIKKLKKLPASELDEAKKFIENLEWSTDDDDDFPSSKEKIPF